jgi:hypothetical protein
MLGSRRYLMRLPDNGVLFGHLTSLALLRCYHFLRNCDSLSVELV